MQVCRRTGVQVYRYAGVQVFKCSGVQFSLKKNNPKLDTRIPVCSFVTFRVPPLDSEMSCYYYYCSVTLRVLPLDSLTGWTGELWSKTNLLNWQN